MKQSHQCCKRKVKNPRALYDSDEEILYMNSTREHAESNLDIDTNRVINDGKEYENQEFKIREY